MSCRFQHRKGLVALRLIARILVCPKGTGSIVVGYWRKPHTLFHGAQFSTRWNSIKKDFVSCPWRSLLLH